MNDEVIRVALKSLGALALVLVLGIGLLVALGTRNLGGRTSVPAEALDLSGDSTELVEGARLARVFGCVGCHGGGLEGTTLIAGMPFMDLPAPNLTDGRSGGRLSVPDWERAVRHGIAPDGRPLLLMPSASYRDMSDRELSQVVAWARSLPPRTSELVERRVGFVGRLVSAIQPDALLHARIIDHDAGHPEDRISAETTEHGAYLAGLCASCHGPDLAGARIHGSDGVVAPDLTPSPDGLGSWAREDFFRLFREGVRPDGSTVGEMMPWRSLGRMSDEELGALWVYLRGAARRE